MTAPALLLLLASLLAPAAPWCIPAGGVGEYSTKCMESSSVGRSFLSFISKHLSEFEACFALCQCYDANDNPTHEHQAICVLDECFCVFDSCPYGR